MMTFGQDLDAMYEARCSREWEEANEEPEIDKDGINKNLGSAWNGLDSGYNRLIEACDLAENTPVWAKIQSVIARIEDMQTELRGLQVEVSRL